MDKLCIEHTTESKYQLKTGGLKVTSARLDLLDALKHAKKPLSVKELAKKLGGVDLVTLYRNIEALENLGAVKKINLNSREAYYELAGGKHHHHIICTNCGKLADVEVNEMNLNKNFLKKHGFAKVTGHSLEFFGLCKACV
jgi:Fe2+ or Zn2+ uptake regulation protein